LVESSIELKKELDETKERCKQYEQIINGLERKLSEADQYNTRLEGANVDKDSKLKTAMHQLSVCQERLDKQKKEEVNDGGSYYRTTKKCNRPKSLEMTLFHMYRKSVGIPILNR
jgi:chromosome segregation ATPase